MIRRTPRSTRTDTLFPYTTLFRSQVVGDQRLSLGAFARIEDAEAAVSRPVRVPISVPNQDRRFYYRVTLDVEALRSEEHTSELQSLMRISYAVFCLKKKNKQKATITNKCIYKKPKDAR